jgi:hypothetical protein
LEGSFFPAYGTPNSVVTDNARVFCGKQFKDVCFRWGIEHESETEWDDDLPWISMAFNTAIHESTKCMPDHLFLGQEMKCPLNVRWNLSLENTDDTGEANQAFGRKRIGI